MAKVIDARSSDGNLVILGKALVLPSVVDDMVTPVAGSIRYNPPNIEVCNDDQWVAASSGEAITSETVTTGADPITADITKSITYITTGGTGGDEHINMPNFDPSVPLVDAFSTPEKNGTQHVFVLSALSDADDLVHVHPGYAGQAYIYDMTGRLIGSFPDGVPLRGIGGSVTLIWQDWGWMVNDMSDMAYEQPVDLSHTHLSTPDAIDGNSANNIGIQAGNADTTGTGGGIYIEAGDSSSTGTGGDVNITAGFAGTAGAILIRAGLSIDNDAGSVTISGGDVNAGDGAGGNIILQRGSGGGPGLPGCIRIPNIDSEAPDFSDGIWLKNGYLVIGNSGDLAATRIIGANGIEGGNAADVSIVSGNGDDTGSGGQIYIYGGNSGSGGTASGGTVEIRGGPSVATNGNGGTADFVSGNAAAGAGNGGQLTIRSGDGGGTTGDGGLTWIAGGAATGSGSGGNIVVIGGNGGPTDGDGGSVDITGGSGNGSGNGGTVTMQGGNASDDNAGGDVRLVPGAGDGAGRDGVIILMNLPIIDPGIPGALWLNSGVLSVSPS